MISSLSQSHLTLLETCPRKFQHIFLEALAVPTGPDQQTSALWGSQFHLLMQQQALGLPIEVMAPADPEMSESVAALRQAAPDLFATAGPSELRQSEHQRTLAFNDYLLTVVYDLLILSPAAGQIIDWKTYQRPPQRSWLETDWQTRLYLYVLAETAALAPEQISMTYWFVRSRDRQTGRLQPESYRFGYSARQHAQTQAALMSLTQQLTQLRQSAAAFPKVDIAKGRCDRCPFAIRCQRAGTASVLEQTVAIATGLDVDSVDEVVL
ncbi:MAG: PD-(D/E)XK nuclease family protein [Leptolyngbya sp. SIO4C1]|nr:PD-(D/E)XK nuclease family protein [Leptolyngbya sp. SIO4C1]